MSTKYEKLSQQRKLLQQEGEAPEWSSTAGFQLLSERNYLDIGETPKDMYTRIAQRASDLTTVGIPDDWGYSNWFDAFMNVMWKGWVSPSTPVLTNMGNSRGHPVSCSGSNLGDSIRSWYETRMEMAQLTQRGYGASTVIGDARYRGAPISTGGSANGVMQPASGIVQDMKDVSQGSSRRGAAGLYIDPLHRDFDEVADQILADDDGWNVGWNITDKFDELFETDPERADYIWKKMMKIKLIKGKGYFFFLDKANRSRPKVYKDKGFMVKGSNLCVSGDTKITIQYDGCVSEIEIETLGMFIEKYKDVEVLSMNIDTGKPEFKKIKDFAMTNPSTKVMKITDEKSQKNISCTEEHLLFTVNRGYVMAKDLEENDTLEIFNSTETEGTTKIEYLEEEIPVFDITVEDNENFFANDILVHNCSEIQLMTDEEHSFTCVLTSMNVSKYNEWVDTKAVEIATVLLDAIVSDMLIKAKAEDGFERVIAFTEKSRAIGLGILGEATYYQQEGWVFGDLQSIMFNQLLVKQLDDRTLSTSQWLAKEVGEPEWLIGYGERFTHRLAFPPTMSTSIIMGGISQGIEPVFANIYEQDTAGGTVFRINPPFLKLMKERGMYTEEVMQRIAEDQGSVQAEDWLTQQEKDIFRTSFEINQYTILKMSGDRQKNMNKTGGGQGQSTNLYFQHDAKEEEISKVHDVAFKDKDIEGLYYVRTLNGKTKVKIEPSACIACEG